MVTEDEVVGPVPEALQDGTAKQTDGTLQLAFSPGFVGTTASVVFATLATVLLVGLGLLVGDIAGLFVGGLASALTGSALAGSVAFAVTMLGAVGVGLLVAAGLAVLGLEAGRAADRRQSTWHFAAGGARSAGREVRPEAVVLRGSPGEPVGVFLRCGTKHVRVIEEEVFANAIRWTDENLTWIAQAAAAPLSVPLVDDRTGWYEWRQFPERRATLELRGRVAASERQHPLRHEVSDTPPAQAQVGLHGAKLRLSESFDTVEMTEDLLRIGSKDIPFSTLEDVGVAYSKGPIDGLRGTILAARDGQVVPLLEVEARTLETSNELAWIASEVRRRLGHEPSSGTEEEIPQALRAMRAQQAATAAKGGQGS